MTTEYIKMLFDEWIVHVNISKAASLEDRKSAFIWYMHRKVEMKILEEFLWGWFQTHGCKPERVYDSWFGEYPKTNTDLSAYLARRYGSNASN